MYKIRDTRKLSLLLINEKRIYRIADLATLWDSLNRNSLTTTIRRYKERKILYEVSKGIYSTVPLDKLHPYEIGCAVSGSLSYVSTETVLEKEGLIMQRINAVTLMGEKKKEFEIAGQRFLCRYLNPKYLVNRIGIKDEIRYSIACKNRAVADIKHVNRVYFIDNTIGFEKEKVKQINNFL